MRLQILWLVGGLLAGASTAGAASAEDELVVSSFMQLLLGDAAAAEQAFEFIDERWQPGFVPMSLEALYLGTSPARNAQLVSLLEAKTHQQLDIKECNNSIFGIT